MKANLISEGIEIEGTPEEILVVINGIKPTSVIKHETPSVDRVPIMVLPTIDKPKKVRMSSKTRRHTVDRDELTEKVVKFLSEHPQTKYRISVLLRKTLGYATGEFNVEMRKRLALHNDVLVINSDAPCPQYKYKDNFKPQNGEGNVLSSKFVKSESWGKLYDLVEHAIKSPTNPRLTLDMAEYNLKPGVDYTTWTVGLWLDFLAEFIERSESISKLFEVENRFTVVKDGSHSYLRYGVKPSE